MKMIKFIQVGDTFIPESDILYFKDQENHSDGRPQTFIKFRDGQFVVIEGHHSKRIVPQMGQLKVTYD